MSPNIDLNIDFKSEKIKKVQELLADTNKKFIIIDGVIGAGKTTVISLIEKQIKKDGNLKVKAIYEPVKLWNDTGVLQYFYKDQLVLHYHYYIYL